VFLSKKPIIIKETRDKYLFDCC